MAGKVLHSQTHSHVTCGHMEPWHRARMCVRVGTHNSPHTLIQWVPEQCSDVSQSKYRYQAISK
eukprot:352987-Chlamydomonas_euryale.AAC.20